VNKLMTLMRSILKTSQTHSRVALFELHLAK
jgi:hypothetical protein